MSRFLDVLLWLGCESCGLRFRVGLETARVYKLHSLAFGAGIAIQLCYLLVFYILKKDITVKERVRWLIGVGLNV